MNLSVALPWKIDTITATKDSNQTMKILYRKCNQILSRLWYKNTVLKQVFGISAVIVSVRIRQAKKKLNISKHSDFLSLYLYEASLNLQIW